MAGTSIEGKNCKVSIGATKVLGIGSWKYTPGTVTEIDDTEFGDTVEAVKIGTRKRGAITFEGVGKKSDSGGQEALKRAFINGTAVALRLYQDTGNYLEPNSTSGYLSPASTSANATLPTTVNITAYDIGVEKAGVARINFTATVSGDMVEVGT